MLYKGEQQMTKQPLKRYLQIYKVECVQLVFGSHLISIDIKLNGYGDIVRAFKEYKTDRMSYNPKLSLLILWF